MRCFLPRLSASEWSSVIIKPPKQNRNACIRPAIFYSRYGILNGEHLSHCTAALTLLRYSTIRALESTPSARLLCGIFCRAFDRISCRAVTFITTTTTLKTRAARAQLELLRRPLDHVIALADCKRVLPRDLARFIHGVHGWPSLQALTNLTSLLKLDLHDAVRSLQSAPSLNGAIWSSRLARLLAKVETTEGALVLLDKVRAAANGASLMN